MHKSLLCLCMAFLISAGSVVPTASVHAQSQQDQFAAFWDDPRQDFAKATVVSIQDETFDDRGLESRTKQTLRIQILSGIYKDREYSITHEFDRREYNRQIEVGETVVVERLRKADGTEDFFLREKYRLPWIIFLGLIFIGIAFLTGGIVGMRSLLGLLVSIGILSFYIVPRIINGADPLSTSLIGSSLIACFSIYLAHGYNRRTTIALVATIITLGISTGLAFVFVYLGKLFGMGSEEVMFFSGTLEWVNLRGLLLGGIVIGALGVLDDITTAQAATVDEISKANANLPFHELYKRGMSVGREHVASLINTLALAYAGASLPLILLFYSDKYYPAWVTFNSEFLAEEIVRTLVGSAALLLAVPISTWLAAYAFQKGNHSSVDKKHACSHHHHV